MLLSKRNNSSVACPPNTVEHRGKKLEEDLEDEKTSCVCASGGFILLRRQNSPNWLADSVKSPSNQTAFFPFVLFFVFKAKLDILIPKFTGKCNNQEELKES